MMVGFTTVAYDAAEARKTDRAYTRRALRAFYAPVAALATDQAIQCFDSEDQIVQRLRRHRPTMHCVVSKAHNLLDP